MKRKFFKFLLILLIGGLGGILATIFVLPYLAAIPPFSKIEFIKQLKDGAVIINKTEKVYIAENQAAEEAIDAISPRLAAIQAFRAGQTLSEGSGFILTSDGWIITAGDLAPLTADKILVYRNGDSFIAKEIRRDSKNNLALMKIEQSNLPVASLAELTDISLGEQVILIGAQKTKTGLYKFVNLGSVRGVNQETVEVNIIENNVLANGGPLINIKGEVIGLNQIDKKGIEKIVPTFKIKELLNAL